MVVGKDVRLNRILRKGKMVCVPMDHGISVGPIHGLEIMGDIIHNVEDGGATAVLIHKGIVKSLRKAPSLGIIVHLSGSTNTSPDPNLKILVGSVEEAIRLGADAVSVHINIGSKEESKMLHDLGKVADDCDAWNIPLIAMMYPRGEKIKNPLDVEVVSHVARIGAELGADLVKTVYTGTIEGFQRVVHSCPVPVVIAGGPKSETDRDVLEMAYGAIQSGAIGVTFGRNVFEHDNPRALVKALTSVVIDGLNVEDAVEILQNELAK